MRESQLVTQIKNYLRSKGAYCEKIFGGGYQSAGIPDLIACYNGQFIAIEVKSPTGKGRASDIQKLKIKDIRSSGGIALITDNLEEVVSIIEAIDDNSLITYDDKYLTK